MRKLHTLHTTLDPDQVILIPAGAGASIRYIEKSGRRARVEIKCSEPVTITSAAAATPAPAPPLARRPVPQTG